MVTASPARTVAVIGSASGGGMRFGAGTGTMRIWPTLVALPSNTE